ILIVFLISSLKIRACISVTDCENEPVSIRRIQWTQLFTAIIVLFFVFSGNLYLTGMFLHATIAGLLLGQYGENMISIVREPKK
ncbi:hypothetical protein KC573_00480, partial [candidate division WWE3 bacterium]|nr:hypothetical protein [candidate division WWE3 bacterium]